MKLAEAYELVKDLISEQEFRAEIEKRRAHFGNLLDDDAIAYMIADELGRNTSSILKISSLSPDSAATFYAKVVGEPQSREFSNGNGNSAGGYGSAHKKITSVDVADETGKCTLVIWNGDATVRKGQTIKVTNGAVKSQYGLEVTLGQWGTVEEAPEMSIEPKYERRVMKIAELAPESTDVCIEGKIVSISPTRTFNRKNGGGTSFVASAQVQDDTGECAVVAWGDQVKLFKDLQPGMKVEVERAHAKKGFRGGVELHLRQSSGFKIVSGDKAKAEQAKLQ
ncbi:MAG: hypothetical protein CVT47_03260 [Thermoplasmata archaeon HGW-Thermoplasmata-2]|nr:MAG: hypothetical protein CVT47_03260 [Thermoplasmata archaeon HGW-Thermoplasmata-2]